MALFIGIIALLSAKSAKKNLEDHKNVVNGYVKEIAELKAQIMHVDLEFIKKILARVTDYEHTGKKLANDLDLIDEKLRSFMARASARHTRKKPAEEDEPEADPQQDIIQKLQEQGHAIPLSSPEASEQQPTTLVRASHANRRVG